MADSAITATPGVGANLAFEVQGALSYQVTVPGAHQNSPYTRTIINAALNGDNTLIAAAVGKKHFVYGFFIFVNANNPVNVKLTDGNGGTSQFGPAFPLLGQGAAWLMPITGNPYFGVELTANTILTLNLSAAVQVGGAIWTIDV